MKFEVHLLVQSTGIAEIEASSLGEAYEKAQDLAAGDFEFINGSDEWREVVQISN